MDNQTLLHADYLDIIFDHRNKNYGGYELRKHYNQRVGRALLSLLLAVSLLVFFSFIAINHKAVTNIYHRMDEHTITPWDHPPVVLPKIPKIQPPPPAPHVKMKIFTDPVITNEVIKPENQMTENKDLKLSQPGLRNNDGQPGVIPGEGKIPGTGVIKEQHDVKSTAPVLWVEQMPQFIGDMGEYIKNHLQYPDAARDANIEGMVLIRFVVSEDGFVSDATVVRGIGGGCDEEALRMVRSMPKWKPGKQNGMAVKVYFTLPIKFVLNG